MSLRVWLPLTKDLRNQGLSDVTVTNNGATFNSAGKLGGCYQFNASGYLKETSINWTNFNTSEFSLCCWYKEPSPVASGNSQMICIGTSSGWNNIRIGLLRRTSNGYPMFSVSDGSNNVNYNFTANSFSLDTWNHIVCTYNNGTMKMYLNGELHKTYTTTIVPVLNSSQHLGIGAASNGAEPLTGYLNDVRIYDHCLSPMEVKQISKGLVLHYPLNRQGWGQENLLSRYVVPGGGGPTSTAAGGRTTWLGDYKITIPATENADTYFRLFMSEQLVSGQTYTISCQVDGLLNGSAYRFPMFAQNNTAMGVLNLDHNGLNSLTFTMNWTGTQTAATGANGETVYVNFLDDSSRIIASGQGAITVSNFKLEKGEKVTPWCPNILDPLYTTMGLNGTTEYDCSGYCNNGIKNNLPTYSSDTAKYAISTHVDGVNQTIQLPNLSTLIPDSIFTFNIWFKRLASEPGSKAWETILGGPSGFEIETCSANNVHDNKIRAYSWGSGMFEFELDKWNMLTMVSNGANALFYLNGELKLTGTYKALVSGNYFLGSWRDTATQNYRGYMCDARIYATALSADDVKSLYQNSAYIDSSGNVYGAVHSEV